MDLSPFAQKSEYTGAKWDLRTPVIPGDSATVRLVTGASDSAPDFQIDRIDYR